MEILLTQVGNFGFPMVIAIYLLVRVEKKLDALTLAIFELGKVVEGSNGVS